MTIDNVQNITPIVQYIATAGQTVFPYPFPITQNTDIYVLVNGIATAAFTVQGAGNDTGGTITLTSGASAGDIVTVYRDVDIVRATQFSQNGPFLSSAFNAEFNKIYLIMQQLQNKLNHTIHGPVDELGAYPALPEPAARAGYYLLFDPITGAPSLGQPSGGNGAGGGNPINNVFTATAGQTVFSLSAPVASTAFLQVTVDGASLVPGVDYTVSTTTLTLTTPCLSGQTVVAHMEVGVTALTPGDGTVTDAKLNANAVVGQMIVPLRRTAVEIAQSILPTNFGYLEGDIRRYGALVSNPDNSGAINKALLVSAAGGAAAFIPAGNWTFTSTLNATGSCSMRGVGQLSVLIANGCDGITFARQTSYQGTRFFRDFSLQGPSTTTSAYNGIVCDLGTGTANAKITGIEFTNLTIQNFQKGVYVNGPYGMWNSSFNYCFLYNNYHGYYLTGQVVYFNVIGGITQTGSMTGSGSRYGVLSQDSGGGNGQSLHFSGGWGAYGYEYNAAFINVFEVTLSNCDLSVYKLCGVFVSGTSGPFSVRDTWIQSAAGVQNSAAIYIADLGTKIYDKIVIDGCTLYGASAAGSCGIYLGHNHGPVTVTNNTIGNSVSTASFALAIGGNTPGALGVSAVGGGGAYNDDAVITNNTIHSLFSAIILYSSVANVTVGPNTIQNGVPLTFSAGSMPPGLRFFAPGMTGTATFVAATSVNVTFSPALPAGTTYKVALSGNGAGYAWAVSKTNTGFTINCSASNSNAVDWTITT